MVLIFLDPIWAELGVVSLIVANGYYEFAVPTSVKGYHMYKEGTIGENLPCWKELNCRRNPLTVAFPGYWIIVGVTASG